MSTNRTAVDPGTDYVMQALLAYELNRPFYYVIFPCTSLLGIIATVTAIVVLTRQGFAKCSNVLLVSLAVSDLLFLIGTNNFPMIVFADNINGFTSSEIINYIFYILYVVFLCANGIGQNSFAQIPVLITGERILALLCPLKVYSILTPKRATIAVACIYLFNGAFAVYINIICIQFRQEYIDGVYAQRLETTHVMNDHVRSGVYDFVFTIVNYMTVIVPLILITTGCVVIGIQIAVIANRRKLMTSRSLTMKSKPAISKTTKTLFSICLLYVACNGFAFIIQYAEELANPNDHAYFILLLENILNLLYCFNIFGDFFIYLGANNSFKRSCNIRRVLSMIKC